MDSKLERLDRLRDDLTRVGWMSPSDLVLKADLDRDAIDHFKAALLQADSIVRWSMGYEDEHGCSPHQSTALSHTLHRLIAELTRIQRGAKSGLFSRQGKRFNSRQVDHSLLNLKILVGLFDRHFADLYRSENQRNRAIATAISEVKKSLSPRQVAEWIEWFRDRVSTARELRFAAGDRFSSESDWGKREHGMLWFYESQLAAQVPINRARMQRGQTGPFREDIDLRDWLLGQISEAAEQCPTIRRKRPTK